MARRRYREERHTLHPTLKAGLVALIFVTIGLIIILSFLGLAGTLGDTIDYWLARFAGTLRYLLPLVLFVLAWITDRTSRQDARFYRSTHLIGGGLLIISLAGLLHLGVSDNSMKEALSGKGGGLVGHFLTVYVVQYLGIPATAIIFTALLVASLLLLFNVSLFTLLSSHKILWRSFGKLGRWFFNLIKSFTRKKEDGEEEATPFMRRLLGSNSQYEDTTDYNDDIQPEAEEFEPTEETISESSSNKKQKKAEEAERKWIAPPLSLLKRSSGSASAGDIKRNRQIIEKTLATFGLEVEMGESRVGPTVTQYTLRPADGVKLNKITGLSNDLSLALAAHPIRIEAPIPGKSLVGIEVPNQKSATVTLCELLSDEETSNKLGQYQVALGKDVGGKPMLMHLPSMPHLLVAGATGSGKTVCINTIILSLIYQHSPQDLKFIMVDPKRVELPLYNGIPHLLTPVITDVNKTINALRWTIGEMERRFDLLSKTKKRDIYSYNKSIGKKKGEQLPVIVFVVDELADLMVAAGAEIEGAIIRLAQMARAVGIHLVLATQRPSVDIITGLLKANIPGRIAFSVTSLTDSRTILDSAGAEKLVGKGDMLYLNSSLSKPKRIQGAFVSEEEMKRVIDFIKHADTPVYDDVITSRSKQVTIFGGSVDTTDDPLYHEARELVIAAGKASASYLQRRLKVGYARAARLLDMLEDAGVIGPAQGSKPRKILIGEDTGDNIDEGGVDEDGFDDEYEDGFEEDEDYDGQYEDLR